jgi:acyl carrier protein|uniref:acyl carrier protein n=1 Tax=Rheinheimera sp. TaxID=1869214 RepID=UPI00404709D6
MKHDTGRSDSLDPTPDATNTLLRHFEPRVKEAYQRLCERRSSEDAEIVVKAIILDHSPSPIDGSFDLSNKNLKLIEDLGFDSVAIAEAVFFIEDLFKIRISNDEILKLNTIGNLQHFISSKLRTDQPIRK